MRSCRFGVNKVLGSWSGTRLLFSFCLGKLLANPSKFSWSIFIGVNVSRLQKLIWKHEVKLWCPLLVSACRSVFNKVVGFGYGTLLLFIFRSGKLLANPSKFSRSNFIGVTYRFTVSETYLIIWSKIIMFATSELNKVVESGSGTLPLFWFRQSWIVG